MNRTLFNIIDRQFKKGRPEFGLSTSTFGRAARLPVIEDTTRAAYADAVAGLFKAGAEDGSIGKIGIMGLPEATEWGSRQRKIPSPP